MIGQHKSNLAVVPYQSGWKKLFEQEAELLRSVLGEKALGIEHIGSTSIPGVDAKPIIDIKVAVASLSKAKELIPAVEGLGYEYKPADIIPERLFFSKERYPEFRTHHLNLATVESSFWKNQIAFRDYLCTHDQIAAEYIDLKKRLAEIAAGTGQIDPDWKTEFVTSVLKLAEEEERASNSI